MRLERVDIAKFRGIDSTSLVSCDALNVLIGKNNSGKSTILDAIDAFFAVASSPHLVASDSGLLGRDSDFHRGDSVPEPIRITAEFSLRSEEHDDIVNYIISEAPQMKNALEDVDVDFRLRVEVASIKRAPEFAYISSIQLVKHGSASSIPQRRVLLSVSTEAALEVLQRKEKQAKVDRQATEIRQILRRIDAEDFQLLKRETLTGERPSSARLRRSLGVSAESSYEIESIMRHAEDYGDFLRQVEALARLQQGSVRADEEPLTHSVDTFSGEAHSIPIYASSILKLVSTINVLHLRDRRDPVGKEEAQRLLSLKTRRKGPEVLRNIQEIVHSLLGVSIDAFESERTSGGPGDGRAEMDVDEVLVEMNGAGIREALRLILDYELSQPQLLLVEEPEIHLHPALELSMLRYLKSASSRTQIFVTTHSTNFLDTSEMRNVYLTRREPWVTATLLDYEQAETAIPDELGLRLSSLFMYDRLVFVEGASDEAILRELAALIDVNFGQTNLGFVVMGSARNFTHYASKATIDLLAKRKVKISFILDRDEASEEEVKQLTEKLGGVSQTHVLKKREIENYLAVPRALAEFISEKRKLQGLSQDDVSEELVAKRLATCADELKQLAVEKRVIRSLFTPIYFDKKTIFETSDAEFGELLSSVIDRQIAALSARKEEIQPLMEQEESHVGKLWESKRLDIVPGDELLNCVCQGFSVRFKKRRDGSRLARLLKADELSTEISELLKSLVS